MWITDFGNDDDFETAWRSHPSVGRPGSAQTPRFDRVWGERVRIEIDASGGAPQIAEFGVYDEMR